MLFAIDANISFADTFDCSKTFNVSEDCSGAVWSSWSSWSYNSSANTCTSTRSKVGSERYAFTMAWQVEGGLHEITQDNGCIDEEWEVCKYIVPATSTAYVGQTATQYACDFPYSWEVISLTDHFQECTTLTESKTSTRPSITKNAMDVTVKVGERIYDSATGEDENVDVTSFINTSISPTPSSWSKHNELSYTINTPGTYTITYSLPDVYEGAETGCGMYAPTRTRVITVEAIEYSWVTGSWSDWSPYPCESGETQTRTREVWCEDDEGTQVVKSKCDADTKPDTTQTRDCPVCTASSYAWSTGSWSPSTCSSGVTQTRSVACKDGDGNAADDECCTSSEPSSSYTCPTDPCSGYSNQCIGTANACSTYAESSCNSSSAPGCSWTTTESCTGTAAACSTYGTSSACTSPSKGCTWSASSYSCNGTATSCGSLSTSSTCAAQPGCSWDSTQGCYATGSSTFTCSNIRRKSMCNDVGCTWSDSSQSYGNYCVVPTGPAWCVSSWTSSNCNSYTNSKCSYVSPSCGGTATACSSRTTESSCTSGSGCSWSASSYACRGTVNACSSYSESVCSSVSGCSWSSTGSCTGTANSCTSRTSESQCTLSGSGCTWCEGSNTAPEINPASDESVCLYTMLEDITTASDAEDGDLTASIVTSSPSGIVKSSQLDYYFTSVGDKAITYDVEDSEDLAATQASRMVSVGYCGAWAYGSWGECSGDPATQNRDVVCVINGETVDDSYCDADSKPDTSQSCDSAPVITPQSDINTYVYTWINDGTTATDSEDGDLTSSIDTNSPASMVKGDTDLEYYFTEGGEYVVTYDVVDSSGNSAVQKTSTVTVSYQAVWETGEWSVCDDNNQRSRTVTCTLAGETVADAYCDSSSKPNDVGACVDADFECTSDNIHWNDCEQTFFLASQRSKICVKQVDPIGVASWKWSVSTDEIANENPQMKIADTKSSSEQETCFDFDGEFVSPEIDRVLRLDIGTSETAGAVEKTINIKLVNPSIQEA